MENLAPAGNRASLEKAVAAGADAVYLGCSAFSARAGAGNFTEDELRDAVHYAHLHHVRVYVTVNTLIKDGELPAVYDLLAVLNSIPVDAVLIQDLGVLSMARTCFPSLPVHASTQMAIHNRTGVHWCAEQGMRCAVLARECSLDEIRLCCKEDIRVETFGHGAQCVGVSGVCLFSSMAGDRSGNRGRCAQPCRMNYRYRGMKGAWLSPRDVCTRDDIPALLQAGVDSLKIEGRLKRPEYVATVAASYRQAIDQAEAGCFQKASDTEKQALRQIFNRGGFMRGYAMGCEDAGVIYPEKVNHCGVPIGCVTAVRGHLVEVELEQTLHNGDGLQLQGKAGDRDLTYSGPECERFATVRLRPGLKAEAGDRVVRLTDEMQMQQAGSMEPKPIPVDLALWAQPGEKAVLTVTDGEAIVSVTGDTVQQAQNRALTREDAKRSLGKMGGTPFALRDFSLTGEQAFLPVAMLNALRRDGLEAMEQARAEAFGNRTGDAYPLSPIELPHTVLPDLFVFRNGEQLQAVRNEEARLCWYPEDFREDALQREIAKLPDGVWFHLPAVTEEATLQMLYRFVQAHQEKLGGVLLGSVGQLGLHWPGPYAAGEDIPVMNRRSAAFLLAQGCVFVMASPELTGQELRSLCADEAPVMIPAWGRTQLMLLHHCPARTCMGLTSGHKDCRMCDVGAPNALCGTALQDEKGHEFPLLRQRLPEGCLVRLMNTLPTGNITKSIFGSRCILLTDEDPAECVAILCEYHGGEAVNGTTSGHWSRPVE